MSEENDETRGMDESSESSTENNPESGTVTEDDKMSDDKAKVPSSRLREESEKRRKAEEELKALRDKLDSLKESPKQEARAESKSTVEARLEAVEFMAKHKEFDAEDYEAAHAIAKGRGVSLEDAIKDNLFIAMQEKKESTKATEEATPTTGRSPKYAAPKPVNEMTAEEHKAYFNKIVKGQ